MVGQSARLQKTCLSATFPQSAESPLGHPHGFPIFYQTSDYNLKIRISWMIQGLEFAISNFQKAFPDIVELNEKDGNRE